MQPFLRRKLLLKDTHKDTVRSYFEKHRLKNLCLILENSYLQAFSAKEILSSEQIKYLLY